MLIVLFKALDNITLRLILQTNNRLFADLTQDDLYEKHIAEEKKKEWKQLVVLRINYKIKKYHLIYF